MATDIIGQVKGVLPQINAGTFGNILYFGILSIAVLIIVIGIFALWAWWYISKKKFNKTIIIWEKVDGKPKIMSRDKAMERKIGSGGDTIFYLQKRKQIVPTPTIQTGDNTYWFAKRTQDGELINIGLEDFDLVFGEAKINFLDKETRYARASLQKLNKDRFNKETFWQKYGRDILTIVFIVIVTVMLLLIASKLVQLTGTISGILESAEKVMDKAAQIMGKLDTICSNSGVS